MSIDTRQDPSNRPELDETPNEPVEEAIDIQTTVDGVNTLIVERESLERYRDLIVSAGKDGLDSVANKLMNLNLIQLGSFKDKVSLENYEDVSVSIEDLNEKIAAIGTKIREYVEKLMVFAKRQFAKLRAGFDKATVEAEELIARAKSSKSTSSQERFEDSNFTINIDNPGILTADGTFEPDLTRVEKDVIRFFSVTWKAYIVEQISRVSRIIKEYDVEKADIEDFESSMAFIGNHKSVVESVTKHILPGDVRIDFKYIALGPELVKAEDVEPVTSPYAFTVRDLPEITNALKNNISEMQTLAEMFKIESEILTTIAGLAQDVQHLEGRRGESIWKASRENLDKIVRSIMELIGKLNPNYDPIVRHLSRIGVARNAVCRKELDALGK